MSELVCQHLKASRAASTPQNANTQSQSRVVEASQGCREDGAQVLQLLIPEQEEGCNA